MKKIVVASLTATALAFVACQNANELTPETQFDALPIEVKHPVANTPSSEMVQLGRMLFFDPILSGEKDVACATCHHPTQGWAEQLDLSIGVGGQGIGAFRLEGAAGRIPRVMRNAPTILNTAFNGITAMGDYTPETAPMFWDNRMQSLESQALGPIESFEEMRGHGFPAGLALDSVVARLAANPEYAQMFESAFGVQGINDEKIGRAIAAFERTLVANNSPFDRWARGQTNAMSDEAQRGMVAFVEAGCASCHGGPMFSDYKLHILSVPEHEMLKKPDAGAGKFDFRTPTLRNLRFTAPYMHNGVFATLEDVMDFYDDLEDGSQNPHVADNQLDDLVDPLDLNDGQVDAILAFLEALNDDSFDKSVPVRVPSGLSVGGKVK